MLSRLFSNHLKIKKSKIADYIGFHTFLQNIKILLIPNLYTFKFNNNSLKCNLILKPIHDEKDYFMQLLVV